MNEKESQSEFRLISIIEANDTEEGNILLKLLKKKDSEIVCCKEDINDENELTTLQASFTRKKDSLTMFRLYGKNNDKEGTGTCIIFENSFFNTGKEISMPINQFPKQDKNAPPIQIDMKDKNEKLPLYYVLYYDKETNELIYNPNKSKYDNIVIRLDDIDSKEWKKPLSMSDDKERIINNIQFVFSRIIELVRKIANTDTENSKLAYMLLINLHYLIKDADFSEESELRLLKIMGYDKKGLKRDFNTDRTYKEYFPIIENNGVDHIKEIILGNKVDCAKGFAETLNIFFMEKQKAIKASVSKSALK